MYSLPALSYTKFHFRLFSAKETTLPQHYKSHVSSYVLGTFVTERDKNAPIRFTVSPSSSLSVCQHKLQNKNLSRIISSTKFNAQFFIHYQNVCYTIIIDMFRALTCPSSGGKIVFTQHLVSSLSVNVCTVHWLRADCSPLSTSVLCRRLQRAKIPDAV